MDFAEALVVLTVEQKTADSVEGQIVELVAC